jgi:hypothetical protein
MAALILAMLVAALAGVASLSHGFGLIASLMIYSVVGQVALLLFASLAMIRSRYQERGMPARSA